MFKKLFTIIAAAVLLCTLLTGCGSEAQTDSGDQSGSQTESQSESQVDSQTESESESRDETSVEEEALSDAPADYSSAEVHLICCYNYTNSNDEPCTYFACAVLAPDYRDISFGLRDPNDDSVGDIYYANTIGHWYVVRGSFEGTYSLSELTLSSSGHGSDAEHTNNEFYFNEWGEEATDEELESFGIYKFGDAYAAIGRITKSYGSTQFGVNVSLIGIFKSGMDTKIDESYADEVLSAYVSDGTPLVEYLSDYPAEVTLSQYYNLAYMFSVTGDETKDEVKALCDSLADLGIYFTHTRSDGTVDVYEM